MAKNQEVEQTQTQTTETNEGTINLVKMEDGSSVNFGARAKVLSTQTVTDTSFSLTFNIGNGKQVHYDFKGDTNLLLEMAAFGAANKVKQACAGLAKFEELEAMITAKVAELSEGIFVSRSGGKVSVALSQLQVAYARVNKIDISTTDGINEVATYFDSLDKEGKAALRKQGRIQIELAKLQLEAKEAEYSQEEV